MEQFDFILAIIVIGFYVVKMLSKRKSSDGGAEDEEESAGEEMPGTETDEPKEDAPVFAHYSDMSGRPRVDVKKSAALSGREITEYEIFTEQKRLDRTYARELEKAEAEAFSESRSPEAGETTAPDGIRDAAGGRYVGGEAAADESVSVEGMKRISGREKTAEVEIVRTTKSGEPDYQLEQLDRWLEAGLIDKKEYRARKKKLERGK